MSQPSAPDRRRAVVAAAVGNIVEWYDFATYGLFAVIIATNFFPDNDPTTGLLATFAVFAVSFLIRPLGAVVFGHLGDRYGRKNVLLATVTLMGFSTIAMGLTPTYASIGVAAPLMLVVFRVVQAFSAGGEWSGSSVYTIEYAPRRHRNLYGSWVQVSASAGTLLGSLTAAVCGVLTSDEQLQQWAWRVPFVVGGLIGMGALLLRLRLEDTPEFTRSKQTRRAEHAPLRTVLQNYRPHCLAAAGVTIGYTVSIYMFSTYMPTYVNTTTGVRLTSALLGNSLQIAVLMALIPFAAMLADRIGSWKVLTAFSAAMALCTVPLFQLISTASIWAVIAGQLAFAVIVSLIGGTAVATTARLFPTDIRYTGLGFSYNIAVAAFGGTAPYISTWLMGSTGSTISPAYYVVLAALVTGVTAVVFLRRHEAGRPSVDAAVPATDARNTER